MIAQPLPPPPKAKPRVFTWVIIGINVLFVVWIAFGVHNVTAADGCAGLHRQALQNCRDGTALGIGLGVAALLFVAALVDVILGVIWMVTRPKP